MGAAAVGVTPPSLSPHPPSTSLLACPPLSLPLAVKLNDELQQLGLPKENSDGISRPYRIHRERLRQQAVADSLRHPRLLSLDWRVDAIVSTSALGQVRKLQVGEGSSSSSSGAALGEALTSLRLGLSHASGTLPHRTPATDSAATPLLQAAALASARAAAGPAALAAPPRMGTPLDLAEGWAAMSALGIRPLEQHSAGSLLSGGSGSGSSSSSSLAASGSGGQAAEGGGVLLTPSVFVDCTLTANAAAALLAELRVANAALQKAAAAMPPAVQ